MMTQWLWNKSEPEQRINLASYVIFSKYSEAVNNFIESAISSGHLPASSHDYHQNQNQGRRELIEKIYNALRHRNLEYDLNEDYSDNDQQIIGKPEEVLYQRRKGTCLDLAILFCAICSHYDLLPILILLDGHALAAVSLTHRGRDWKNDERAGQEIFWKGDGSFTNASQLQRMVERCDYLAVECTGFSKSKTLEYPNFQREDGLLSFEQASKLGIEQLNKKEFKFALDIQIAYYFWWAKLCRQGIEVSAPKTLTNKKNLIQHIYVPLGLIERKPDAKPRPKDSSVTPDNPDFNQPDKQYEIIKEYDHDEFFTTVLAQKSSSKSQGKRLVIVGDPGGGKSTLLQKIADWVINEKQGLPIWISLAQFNDELTKAKDISDEGWLYKYLSTNWLRNTSKEPELTPEIWQQIFKSEILKGNHLWLILDGADEMAVSSPLKKIKEQLTLGWAESVRVVLSCRLNLWSESKDVLSDKFDVYRTLDFNYPNQVDQFIENWFGVDRKLANELQKQLEETNRERLRNLVKNPLRLALLCSIWEARQGTLPNTKAGFYKLIVDNAEFSFNEWNKDKSQELFSKLPQREELKQALGKLARTAISSKDYRFRLRLSLIQEKLGHPDDEPNQNGNGSFFWWALRLGWLLNIGYQTEDEKNPEEKVYAFLHPTFQEYFAATAVERYDFFLPASHKDKPVKDESYRIFEPQWKEVILLWLGRSDVDDSLKNEFIQKLINFKSGCGDFYWYRAYFIAAEGLAEFENCNAAKEIVNKIVKWNVWDFNFWESLKYIFNIEKIRKEAETALFQTHRKKAIAALVELTRNAENESNRRQAAYYLGKIGAGNKDAIAALVELMGNAQDESTRWRAAESLGKIDPGNSDAIAALVKLMGNAQNESTRWRAAESLGKIDPGNKDAITALVKLMGNAQDESTHRETAYYLGKIDPGNSDAIAALVELTCNVLGLFTSVGAASSLKEILTVDQMPFVVTKLKNYSKFYPPSYSVIWYCAQSLSYPEFYQAWHR